MVVDRLLILGRELAVYQKGTNTIRTLLPMVEFPWKWGRLVETLLFMKVFQFTWKGKYSDHCINCPVFMTTTLQS